MALVSVGFAAIFGGNCLGHYKLIAQCSVAINEEGDFLDNFIFFKIIFFSFVFFSLLLLLIFLLLFSNGPSFAV